MHLIHFSSSQAQLKCDAHLTGIFGVAQVERNANALVVSTENITLNWYPGDDRSMLIPNTLFRMGCAAVVLTNRPASRRRAKYELRHITRVHLGADKTAYRCGSHPICTVPSDPIPCMYGA